MENSDIFGIAIAVVILGVAFLINRRVKSADNKDKQVSRYTRVERDHGHDQEP